MSSATSRIGGWASKFGQKCLPCRHTFRCWGIWFVFQAMGEIHPLMTWVFSPVPCNPIPCGFFNCSFLHTNLSFFSWTLFSPLLLREWCEFRRKCLLFTFLLCSSVSGEDDQFQGELPVLPHWGGLYFADDLNASLFLHGICLSFFCRGFTKNWQNLAFFFFFEENGLLFPPLPSRICLKA